jgi:hypothetical protein
MLINQLVEILTRTVSSALQTDQSRFDNDYVLALIDVAASWAKGEKFKKEKNLPNQWYYTKYVKYDPSVQDSDDYKRFEIPQTIVLPYGFSSISTITGTEGNTVPIYKTKAEYLSQVCHPLLGTRTKTDTAVVNGNFVEMYGTTAFKRIEVTGLFTNILNDPTFNPLHDQYPITEELVWLMNTFIIQQYLNTASIRPIGNPSETIHVTNK